MSYQSLIGVDELHARLSETDWVLVDCRFDLAAPAAGRAAYRAGHLPGARYAHLDEDLSGPVGPRTGRHPLPSPETLARRFSAWGIGQTSQVVAYDDRGGAFAARLWWLLRWLGHEAAAVLDGGLPAWRRRGYPLDTRVPEPVHGDFVPRPREDWSVDAGHVARALAEGGAVLVDAREAPRFRGEHEPIDPVAGHIPGAVNLPFGGNLDGQGRFLEPAALRRRLEGALAGAPAAESIHMCGSGVTACHNLLAMAIAGLGDGRLYGGSWSEWIRDPQRPVARGE